jgi:hypothetical protein
VKLTSLLASIATVACAALPLAPAQAAPVTWLVSGFGFDDGGTLSGSFVFDAAVGSYSDIHLTTTAGGNAAGATYGDPFPRSPGNGLVLLAVADDTLPLPGQPLLVMLWDEELSDAGGTAHLSFGYEGFVADDLSTPGLRVLTTIGEVHSAVPEPGSMTLVGLALTGLAWSRRRPATACPTHAGSSPA